MTNTTPTSGSSNCSWNERNFDGTKELAKGITLQWLENGRIVFFDVNTVDRAAIDIWLGCSLALVKSWPAEVPYLAIQSVVGSALTPYTRERSAQTVALTPKYLRGRSAVVMPRTIFNQAIQLFVTINLARENTNIQRKVFLDRAEAVRWLLAFHL